MEDALYIKTFNQGYILAQHTPDLVEALKSSLKTDNDYNKALLQGADQYQKDKSFAKDRETSKDIKIEKDLKDQGIDMDKDR